MSQEGIRAAFAIPGNIETITGGYNYDRRLLRHVPDYGVALRHLQLPGGFPRPSAAEIAATARLLAEADADVLLIDGLAYGALPQDVIAAAPPPIVALVHHPLAYEPGLEAGERKRFQASERAALAQAKHIIATSRATARTLSSEFGVVPDRLTVAEPGTEPQPRARGSGGDVPQLLAVGFVAERKGYAILVEALGDLAELNWHLDIAGSLERDPATAARLRRQIAAAGLGGRIRLRGELSDAELAAVYERADLFVSASLYEGYGMALSEAMAHGLPIVTSTGGAAAETVPEEAALKVPPGDAPALCAAIGRALRDSALRRRLGEVSWRAGQTLPRWPDTVARVAGVLRQAAVPEPIRGHGARARRAESAGHAASPSLPDPNSPA